MLITITGFTVAHSITLALSALDLVRIATPPVEAAIALSVVFMAWEIARGNDGSLTYRYPVTVSSSFGLLHGFGFAAVLRDIGLPQIELPTALLFFNVGVEIGQILFVVALLTGFVVLRPVLVRLLRSARDQQVHWSSLTSPASYVIGAVASYWLIDRSPYSDSNGPCHRDSLGSRAKIRSAIAGPKWLATKAGSRST